MRAGATTATLFMLSLAAPTTAAEEATVEFGGFVFEAYCQKCHGPTGKQGPAGDIRGLPASIVARAVGGVEEMPAVELSAEDLTAVVAWLAGAGSEPGKENGEEVLP